jgi:pyruvate/2-oxoglutarate/acetoin dehydrogenase E1 component
VIHVAELTQPQGHSTSGSHERYKPRERLAWEEQHDCLKRMRAWMLAERVASERELDATEAEAAREVRAAKSRAWEAYQAPIREERRRFVELAGALRSRIADGGAAAEIDASLGHLDRQAPLLRRHLQAAAHEVLIAARGGATPERAALAAWLAGHSQENRERYSSDLHASGAGSALAVMPVPARFPAEAPVVNGFEILNACFDAALARHPELIAFGEDVGHLGDVNQAFAGLQAKYGKLRVSDTGIRETTIMGQAIGLALRGLRPIAEIQYLDYILYGIQTLSDDLASLRYRTRGGQAAPVIVRTRGHRLEGIWHSGSQLGGILNLLRGVWVCVPRNMTQAAGMYNTLLAADDPAVVVEVLNGYRVKERLPANVGEFRVPLGIPEILRDGQDATLVTYGACCRIALEAADLLEKVGIGVEVIDLQTLTPFDVEDRIVASLRRTSRLVVVDEDVPGGASAFVLQQLLERQGGFWWLDQAPVTVTGREHRPAYGSDGDYFSKPSREEIFAAVYGLLHEAAPGRYPKIF